MARTAITSARTALSVARTGLSAAGTALSAFKVPIDFVGMGITNLWDFRTGKLGSNNSSVADLIGTANLNWRGTSALSSVYTSGEYSADLERSNNDHFASNPLTLNNGTTQLSFFAWFKVESITTLRHFLTHWDTVGNQRGFNSRLNATDQMEMNISVNGTSQSTYTTTETLTDTTNWHFILFSYDTVSRGQIFLDNVAQTTTLTAGSHPASIFSGNVPVLIGANLPSAPANFFDGKIGICGIARSTALSSTQRDRLYEVTRRWMGV